VKNLDCRQDGAALGARPAQSWLFNSTIAGIERPTSCCSSAPTRASRRRCSTPASASSGSPARPASASSASKADLTFDYDYLGAGAKTLSGLAKSKGDFAEP
jgi:NADH-quinone oxidoreductase subunit G